MKNLFGVLLDVQNSKVEKIEIEDSLDEFYRILNCSLVDMPVRKIGNKYFTIICDDEGLFAEDYKISATDNFGQPQLVGNLFIVSAENVDGELQSLTNDDADYILEHVLTIFTRKHPEGYPALTQVEY